ncbi:MAG: tRNA1(Val) (adenine(37)-N6)-methyltransferase [Eubacteriales bacterium]|nr:tRNA1(Val) (adenine(37)-N6)-methyltransferase [Eubacteriales bacterium]MDD4078258.1 tRNA1(Val) (adenine(37)-N6)-methyltransferase [Eubacteriales bacterium]
MTERIDDIGGGLKLIQQEGLFALGTDAVLLSKFASLYANDRVIDLGTGTGSIPLMLTLRKELSYIAALELQPELAALCRRSVELNKLNHLIEVIAGDIRKVHDVFPAESFDLATCNPPYMPVTGSLINARKPVAIARHELCCQLEDVVKAFAWLVRYGGKAALVYRPQRLGDIFCLLREHGLEPKRLQFVYPRPGKEANIVLVEAEKGAKPGLRTLPPLTLRGDGKDSKD